MTDYSSQSQGLLNNPAFRSSYFVITPGYIKDDPNLNNNDRMMYSIILSLSNKYGFCWATNKYLANEAHIYVRSVPRILKKLVKEGHLIVEIEHGFIRKIWTQEAYSQRDRLLRIYGEEQLNQRFTGDVTDDMGGMSLETSIIYKNNKQAYKEKVVYKNAAPPTSHPVGPPVKKPDKPKPRQSHEKRVTSSHKKREERFPKGQVPVPIDEAAYNSENPFYNSRVGCNNSIAKPIPVPIDEVAYQTAHIRYLSDEDRLSLEDKFGKDEVAKRERNLEEHLAKCPRSKLHNRSRKETVYQFCIEAQQAKAKQKTSKEKQGMFQSDMDKERERVYNNQEAHVFRSKKLLKEAIVANDLNGKVISSVATTSVEFIKPDGFVDYGDLADPMIESKIRSWVDKWKAHRRLKN